MSTGARCPQRYFSGTSILGISNRHLLVFKAHVIGGNLCLVNNPWLEMPWNLLLPLSWTSLISNSILTSHPNTRRWVLLSLLNREGSLCKRKQPWQGATAGQMQRTVAEWCSEFYRYKEKRFAVGTRHLRWSQTSSLVLGSPLWRVKQHFCTGILNIWTNTEAILTDHWCTAESNESQLFQQIKITPLY